MNPQQADQIIQLLKKIDQDAGICAWGVVFAWVWSFVSLIGRHRR